MKDLSDEIIPLVVGAEYSQQLPFLVSFHLFDSIQQQGCSALYEVPSTEDQSFNVLFKIWGGEKEGSV